MKIKLVNKFITRRHDEFSFKNRFLLSRTNQISMISGKNLTKLYLSGKFSQLHSIVAECSTTVVALPAKKRQEGEKMQL